MNNFQTQVLRAQINLLWHIRQTHEIDLTTNQIDWIDEDMAYVEVKYLNDPNDSTRADEFREEMPESITFLCALDVLTVRINNTIEYLELIIDPDQSEKIQEPELVLPSNVKLSYLYRDYSNYKNRNEVVFSNPDHLSIDQIKTKLINKLMDGIWFYACQWGLKDLHFDKWDVGDDHPYHEFESIELTREAVTENSSINQFLATVSSQTKIP